MMTCRELTDFLSDYVAGDLPDPVHRQFEFHIRLCRDCRVFLAQFRETIAASHEAFDDVAPHAPVPEDVVEAVMRAVTEARDD